MKPVRIVFGRRFGCFMLSFACLAVRIVCLFSLNFGNHNLDTPISVMIKEDYIFRRGACYENDGSNESDRVPEL